ncbi:hypothetical protein SAMN04487970_102512 [Paenibacillus tianmuensis]|uniref:Uncharacterized protein n=1 Tax=Paenibacillus tianmuensis TaxID=624147 RepID=A0A1G4S965_9BACL|nr:hypothetical protein SAMN04487970_102512 [Paenibacillus tianmuensis]
MPDQSVPGQERYWIGVVSASHVSRGVQGGFASCAMASLRRSGGCAPATGLWLYGTGRGQPPKSRGPSHRAPTTASVRCPP